MDTSDFRIMEVETLTRRCNRALKHLGDYVAEVSKIHFAFTLHC